jgi:ubiquinone/menaquinone biosynthesis C-methylase UbiE
MNKRGLSLSQTESFYDALGIKQDGSGYYADAAWENLIAHANFASASKVVEFGCGTGKFAEILFTHHLPAHATYWVCDSSSTMINLSKQRLSKFSERVEFHKTSGEAVLPLQNESVDCFVSNYVLDILSFAEIESVIGEAKRVLKKDGLLCLSGLTYGKTLSSKLWTRFWQLRFTINPKWVGGCRPVALLNFLPEWDVAHYQVLTARGISSEVVIARKR